MWAYGVTYRPGGCKVTRPAWGRSSKKNNKIETYLSNCLKWYQSCTILLKRTFNYKRKSFLWIKWPIPIGVLKSGKCDALKLGSCCCILGVFSLTVLLWCVCVCIYTNWAIGAAGEQWRHWELSDVANSDWDAANRCSHPGAIQESLFST